MPPSTIAYLVRSKGAAALGPWRLTDPGPGEVLVEVKACALNFADLLMIEGTYQDMPTPPFAPGMEFAGRVTAVGPGAASLAPGDRVAVFSGSGGLAGYAVVPAETCHPLPDSIDDIGAAGFFVAYGTAHLALTRRARLAAGETLLVLGAAGGVGLAAVQVGKRLGARVVAVARAAERLAAAGQAGADTLIDSDHPDLVAAFRKAGPIDVVFDAVGGSAGESALRALAPEGRHLLIGFASGSLPSLRANHILVKNQSVIGFFWGGYRHFRPDAVRASLAELLAWHAEGHLFPHVSHVLPLERVEEGLDLLRRRKATGKIVVTPSSAD